MLRDIPFVLRCMVDHCRVEGKAGVSKGCYIGSRVRATSTHLSRRLDVRDLEAKLNVAAGIRSTVEPNVRRRHDELTLQGNEVSVEAAVDT